MLFLADDAGADAKQISSIRESDALASAAASAGRINGVRKKKKMLQLSNVACRLLPAVRNTASYFSQETNDRNVAFADVAPYGELQRARKDLSSRGERREKKRKKKKREKLKFAAHCQEIK